MKSDTSVSGRDNIITLATLLLADVPLRLSNVLWTFPVSLISSYPGNLAANGTTMTTGSLVISFLLLCLWSMGGGLVSLFGTWIATVRHPQYLKLGEESE